MFCPALFSPQLIRLFSLAKDQKYESINSKDPAVYANRSIL